jgi:hypothetical protein
MSNGTHPEVEPKQEKKNIAVRLDEEIHRMLQGYPVFIGNASHEHIIVVSLYRIFVSALCPLHHICRSAKDRF